MAKQKKEFKTNAPGLCKKRAVQMKDKVKNAAIKPLDLAPGTGGLTYQSFDKYCAELNGHSASGAPASNPVVTKANCKNAYG